MGLKISILLLIMEDSEEHTDTMTTTKMHLRVYFKSMTCEFHHRTGDSSSACSCTSSSRLPSPP